MRSPFPGMDPYIEACGLWEDFHSHLIEKIGEKLADAAPDRYLVRTGERSYIVLLESEGVKSHSFLPDVSVSRSRGRKRTTKKGGAALAMPTAESEPMTCALHSRGASRNLHRNLRGESRSAAGDKHRGPVTFQQASRHGRVGPVSAQAAKPTTRRCKPCRIRPAPRRPAHANARSVARQSLHAAGGPRESPTLPSLAGRLSSTVAAHSRAPHEARSRYPSGPSAADRRDLSAFSVRAKHRLQQATQPAARLRRSPLAGDAAKEKSWPAMNAWRIPQETRRVPVSGPAKNSPRPRSGSPTRPAGRETSGAQPGSAGGPAGDQHPVGRHPGRSPGAGGRCRPAPDRPARRDGPARPDGNGRRTRAIRRAGRRCPGRAGSSVRPSARVLGSVGAAVSGSLGAPRRFRR